MSNIRLTFSSSVCYVEGDLVSLVIKSIAKMRVFQIVIKDFNFFATENQTQGLHQAWLTET